MPRAPWSSWSRKSKRLLLFVNWEHGFSNTHDCKDQMQYYEVLSVIREIVAAWWLDGISAMSDTTHLLSGRSSQRAGNLFTSLSSFSSFCSFSLFFQLLHNGSPDATYLFVHFKTWLVLIVRLLLFGGMGVFPNHYFFWGRVSQNSLKCK